MTVENDRSGLAGVAAGAEKGDALIGYLPGTVLNGGGNDGEIEPDSLDLDIGWWTGAFRDSGRQGLVEGEADGKVDLVGGKGEEEN